MVMFHAPRWSPDGKWLVLSSNVDGPDEEIWLVSADGKTRRKLTDNGVADRAVALEAAAEPRGTA
jgi:Tol biopolymer transport system component